MASELITNLSAIVIVLDILAAIRIVFVERRDPANAIPWLIILLIIPLWGIVLFFTYGIELIFLPLFGLLFYLVFGLNYFKPRRFEIKAEEDREELEKAIADQKMEIEVAKTNLKDPSYAPYIEAAQMLLASNQAFVTLKNEVKIYVRGDEKFDDLLNAIKNAKKFIHMEYYIIRNDELGNKVITALVEKAKEGVEVRFLVDALGNKIPKNSYQALISAGGKVAVFYKTRFGGLTIRVNYHDHRKIAVIDGEVGFLGGFNIGDEYLGKGPLGWWRDTAMEVRGRAIQALQLRFLIDWNYATKEDLISDPRYFPPVQSDGTSIIQIINGGPDTKWDPIKDEYLKLVNAARRCVYLQTPYFVPDQSIMDALRTAALSGVDVRIMFPNKPDHPLVYWASYSYVGELLKAGARAYMYDNGFIHAKTVTVDDLACSIGTGNWDIRSFRLNFETNAVIYDKDVAKQMRLIYEEDIKKCTELTQDLYDQRSNWIKAKESVSRLFSSVL